MYLLPWNIVLNVQIEIKDFFSVLIARKCFNQIEAYGVCAGNDLNPSLWFNKGIIWYASLSNKNNEKQFIFLLTRIVSYYFSILWMCPNWYSRYANYDKREQSQTLRYIVAIRHVPCKWKWLRFPWPPSSNS